MAVDQAADDMAVDLDEVTCRFGGGQQLLGFGQGEHAPGFLVIPHHRFQSDFVLARQRHKALIHIADVAQGDQHIFQELTEIAAGHQTRLQGAQPRHFLHLVAIEKMIDPWLAQVEDDLGQNDGDDHEESQGGVGRQSQNGLDFGNGEDQRHHDGSHHWPAQDEVEQLAFHHPVGSEDAVVGDAVSHGHQHDAHGGVGDAGQDQHHLRAGLTGVGDQNQVGKDAQARGGEAPQQVGEATPGGVGAHMRPGQQQIPSPRQGGDDEIEGEEGKERAGAQIGDGHLRGGRLHQNVGE